MKSAERLLNIIKLIEAKSLTVAEVNAIGNSLSSMKSLGSDGSEKVEVIINKDNFTVEKQFRNRDFFTNTEEDDDSPDFTGKDKVIKKVKSFLGNRLKGLSLEVFSHEKSWFSISISGKVDTAGLDKPKIEQPLHMIGVKETHDGEAFNLFINEIIPLIEKKWSIWAGKLEKGNKDKLSESMHIKGRDVIRTGLSFSLALPIKNYDTDGYQYLFSPKVSVTYTPEKGGSVDLSASIRDTSDLLGRKSTIVISDSMKQNTTNIKKLAKRFLKIASDTQKLMIKKSTEEDVSLKKNGFVMQKDGTWKK